MYKGHRGMDEFVHGNEHRMAARGNATLFPLLWQDLLKQLTVGETMKELGRSASLPRSCQELAHVVYIIFKKHLMHTMTLMSTWPVLLIKQWYDVVWP